MVQSRPRSVLLAKRRSSLKRAACIVPTADTRNAVNRAGLHLERCRNFFTLYIFPILDGEEKALATPPRFVKKEFYEDN